MGVIIILGLSITVIWLLSAPSAPRPVTLTNGLTLEYLGSTYGTNHVQPGFSRMARLLPRPLKAWLGLTGPAPPISTERPSLVIWLREDAFSVSNRLGRIGFLIDGLLADEHGITAGTPAPHIFVTAGRRLSRGASPFALLFRSVPGGSRTLTLKLVHYAAGSGNRLLGELQLPNPAFREAPTWKAEALPLCRTNGTLTCRLEQLAVGLGRCGGPRALGEIPVATPEEAPRALSLFRFQENGLPAWDWTVGKALLTDATGNVLSFEDGRDETPRTWDELRTAAIHKTSESWVHHHVRGSVVQYFGTSLWPDEVWGVTVWAKRGRNGSFAEEELVELDGISVDELKATNRLEWSFHKHGTEVRIERLAPEPLSTTASANGQMEAIANLRMTFPSSPDMRFCDLLSIEDWEPIPSFSGWMRRGSRPNEFILTIYEKSRGAKTLTIRISLQKGRRFDFRVKPEVVGTNGFQLRS